MRQFLSRLWRWGPFRRSVMIYLALRVGLSLWAILALTLVPADLGPTDPNPPRPYLGLEPILEGVSGRLLGPWQRFDTLHYLYLAIHGYQPGTPQTVFAPLYPALIRWVGEVFARQYLVAALIISNLSAIGYLTVFSVLAESEIGAPAMHKAQAYAALYPWAFFLLAGYAEPLFLLLVALTLWMSLRGQGWAAGLFGLLAALTRLQGATLVVPLLFQAVRARQFRLWPLRADLLWPLLPGLGGAAFLIGRAWAGLEPISMTYATHWGQAFALPWVGMMTIVRNALQGTAHLTDYFDLGIVLSFIALVVAAWPNSIRCMRCMRRSRCCSISRTCGRCTR